MLYMTIIFEVAFVLICFGLLVGGIYTISKYYDRKINKPEEHDDGFLDDLDEIEVPEYMKDISSWEVYDIEYRRLNHFKCFDQSSTQYYEYILHQINRCVTKEYLFDLNVKVKHMGWKYIPYRDPLYVEKVETRKELIAKYHEKMREIEKFKACNLYVKCGALAQSVER